MYSLSNNRHPKFQKISTQNVVTIVLLLSLLREKGADKLIRRPLFVERLLFPCIVVVDTRTAPSFSKRSPRLILLPHRADQQISERLVGEGWEVIRSLR